MDLVNVTNNGRSSYNHHIAKKSSNFNNNDLKRTSLTETDENDAVENIDQFSFDQINKSANFLLDSTTYRPKIGIICGSGLGTLAENIQNADTIPYQAIPHFPVSTVVGHNGQMIFGLLNNVPVMCMQGRFHYYEGYSLAKCTMPIRVMKLVGVTHLIVTNAAGSLNETYNVGDIMFIKDHINFMGLAGNNPLRGPNDARFGPRFLPTNQCYDKTMRSLAKQVSYDMGLKNEVREGVYMCTAGPTYETVAESRLLRMLGGDSVGMSTVPEVVLAKHCGIKVLGISFISNKCITDYDCTEEIDHQHVVEIGKQRQPVLSELVRRIVAGINTD